MFNFLKRNTVANSTSIVVPEDVIDTIIEPRQQSETTPDFPTAKEMIKKTSENWPLVEEAEILEKILKKSQSGERYSSFYNSLISNETTEKLKALGYKVYISELDGVPYFRINW